MKKLSIKILGAIVVIIMLVQNTVVIAATQNDLNNINKQIEAKKDELNNIKEEKSDKLEEVEKLNTQISEYQKQIDELDIKISEMNSKLQEEKAKLEKAQEDFDKQEKLMEARLVATQEQGETSFLDVLLSSNGIMDFISKYYFVTELVSADTELLEDIKKQKEEIKQAKEKIEASKKELDTTKASKQGVTNQLRNAKNEKNAQVEQLSEEEKETQAELDKFEADKATIRKEIEEAAKKYQNNSKPTGGTNVKPGNPSASGFIRPIPGYSITCGWYGYAGHTGADYSGSNMYGKAVLAAKSGVVLTSTTKTGGIPNYGSDGNYVGSYSSYGEYIIIDHQDGTMTLYAHGKPGSRLVSKGQKVSQGQQIMSVGNTGNVRPRPTPTNPLGGTHLHVEVWVNGKPVNPANYIP